MKLKSFGCSFTYGNDLEDCDWFGYSFTNGNGLEYCDLPGWGASQKTWPALLAKENNLTYECYAWPGIGNLQIMHEILTQSSLNDPSVYVVNWTWTDRFDFLDPLEEHWRTLRPDGDTREHQLYYRYFYNQYHTMLTNACYIKTTADVLISRGIKFIMTIMDTTLFDEIDPGWQDPRSISLLQKEIKPYITNFDNLTFLEWSKQKGFPISETLHPLEHAHQAGFELIRSYNLV
jgi:hypothetical protein